MSPVTMSPERSRVLVAVRVPCEPAEAWELLHRRDRPAQPVSDEAVNGRDAVAAALRGVDAACDEFRHTHLLVDTACNERPLCGLVSEARVGDHGLRGVDLIEIDESADRIATFTVMARPVAALMALGARMTGSR
jgi:hypothetical protein